MEGPKRKKPKRQRVLEVCNVATAETKEAGERAGAPSVGGKHWVDCGWTEVGSQAVWQERNEKCKNSDHLSPCFRALHKVSPYHLMSALSLLLNVFIST